MKVLKFLLYTALALVALLGLLGLFAKKNYHIERSIEIEAPKSLVFENVSKFRNFDKWSPWNELDTNMTKTYEGEDGTVGASYRWVGNEEAGEGKQTLTEINADQVETLLDIQRPFKMVMPANFVVTGDDQKTKVSWSIDPRFKFPMNVWAMFTDVDEAFGKDYERGLGNLKKHCENIAHPKYNGYEVTETQLPPAQYLGFRANVDTTAVAAFFADSMPRLFEALEKTATELTGPPSGLFWAWADGKADCATAAPVKAAKKYADGLSVFALPGGRALVVDYFGPSAGSMEAHLAMDEYMAKKNLDMVPPVLEEYVTDPATEPDTAKWLTKVIYFVKPKVDSTSLVQ
jgi:hypothetical protein